MASLLAVSPPKKRPATPTPTPCGTPPGWAPKTAPPAGVQAGSVTTPADSRSTRAAAGLSTGQRSSAHRPTALRVAAIERPSGDGTSSPHVAPAGPGGTATVGRVAAGAKAVVASLPPPPPGLTRRAPYVSRRQEPSGSHRYRSRCARPG